VDEVSNTDLKKIQRYFKEHKKFKDEIILPSNCDVHFIKTEKNKETFNQN
jgi:hypothetical protein